MKYLHIILLFMSLSVSAQAGSLLKNLRYGVGAVNQKLVFDAVSDTSSVNTSESNTGFSIFAEKFFKRKYRVSGSAEFVSHTDSKIISTTLSADYIHPIDGRTALYGGLAIGGVGQQYNGSSLTDMSLGTLTGAQLGAVFFINNHLTIDLAYRLRRTNLEAEVAGTNVLITTTDLDALALGFVINF